MTEIQCRGSSFFKDGRDEYEQNGCERCLEFASQCRSINLKGVTCVDVTRESGFVYFRGPEFWGSVIPQPDAVFRIEADSVSLVACNIEHLMAWVEDAWDQCWPHTILAVGRECLVLQDELNSRVLPYNRRTTSKEITSFSGNFPLEGIQNDGRLCVDRPPFCEQNHTRENRCVLKGRDPNVLSGRDSEVNSISDGVFFVTCECPLHKKDRT